MFDVDIDIPEELTIVRLAETFHCLPKDIENMSIEWYEIIKKVKALDSRRAEIDSKKNAT